MVAIVTSNASVETQTRRLQHALNSLPKAATSFNRVNRITTSLTKLHPSKAFKYYKTGLTRLSYIPETANANTRKLAFIIFRIVKKSNLSEREKGKIQSLLFVRFDDTFEISTPTPEPTP